jgi:hypothetical protein
MTPPFGNAASLSAKNWYRKESSSAQGPPRPGAEHNHERSNGPQDMMIPNEILDNGIER